MRRKKVPKIEVKTPEKNRGISKGIGEGEAHAIEGRLGECGTLEVTFLKSGTVRGDHVLLTCQL